MVVFFLQRKEFFTAMKTDNGRYDDRFAYRNGDTTNVNTLVHVVCLRKKLLAKMPASASHDPQPIQLTDTAVRRSVTLRRPTLASNHFFRGQLATGKIIAAFGSMTTVPQIKDAFTYGRNRH